MQKSTKIANSWQGSKKSKSLFFCIVVDLSKVYKRYVVFYSKDPLVFKKNVENRFKSRRRFYKLKAGLKFTTIRLTRVSK